MEQFRSAARWILIASFLCGAAGQALAQGAGQGRQPQRGQSAPPQIQQEAPEPATIAEADEDEATGIWSAWLESGVRVHHRRMDGEGGSGGAVLIQASLASGAFRDAPGGRGLADAAAVFLQYPSFEDASPRAVQRYLQRRGVRVQAGIAGDRVQVRVAAEPGQAEVALGMLGRILREAQPDADLLEQWTQFRRQRIEGAGSDLGTLVEREQAVALSGGPDHDAAPLRAEDLEGISIDAVEARLDRIQQAPAEVAIVGDLARDDAIDLVTTHLGGLASRERIGPDHRAVPRTSPISEMRRITVERSTPGVEVLFSQATTGPVGLEQIAALDIAAGVLWDRLDRQVRAGRGLGDRIETELTYEHQLLGRPMLTARVEGPAGSGVRIARALRETARGIARDGVTSELLERERARVGERFAERVASPGAWANQLSTMSYHDLDPAWIADGAAKVESLSGEDVERVIAEALTPERWITLIIESTHAEAPRQPRWWLRPTPDRGI